MNNYQDKYQRFHDKPVTSSDPYPSNNAFIYTSYARKLGIPFDMNQVTLGFYACFIDKNPLVIYRNPNQKTPPFSRDEVLGLAYLRLLAPKDLQAVNWNFSPYGVPKFNLITLLKHLWEIIHFSTRYGIYLEHRNYFWQKGLDQIYRFAFSVPLQDRAFIYRCQGLKAPLFYRIYEKLSNLLPSKTNSGKLIQWLKTGNKPDLKVFQEYFGEEHIFTQKVKETLW